MSRNQIKTVQPVGKTSHDLDLRRDISEDSALGRNSAAKSYSSIASHVDIEHESPNKGSPPKGQGKSATQALQASFGKNTMTAV